MKGGGDMGTSEEGGDMEEQVKVGCGMEEQVK